MKHTNIRIIEIPQEEEKKKGYKKNFDVIIVENFPMEKETSNTIRLKKNKEKAEKYCTNEGTNEKHRSPNKLRKLGKLPEKEFRIMIVKMIKKKKKESIAEYLKWKNKSVSRKIKW